MTWSVGRGCQNRFSSWGGMSVQIHGPAGSVPCRAPVPVPLGTASVVPPQPCQQVTAVLAEQGWGAGSLAAARCPSQVSCSISVLPNQLVSTVVSLMRAFSFVALYKLRVTAWCGLGDPR